MVDRLNLPPDLKSLIEKRELEERRQQQTAEQDALIEHSERRKGTDRRTDRKPPPIA